VTEAGDIELAASAGVALAQQAIRTYAAGDQLGAVDLINRGSEGEVAWACGYLLSALETVCVLATGGDRSKAARVMVAGSLGVDDAIANSALVILERAEREISNG